MKPKSVFASCVVVVITLLSTSAAATAGECPVRPPRHRCQGRCNIRVDDVCILYCGCHYGDNYQVQCWEGPPCDPGYRPFASPLEAWWGCERSGDSWEPTTNSTVTVQPQPPDEPVWGFASIHEHQFANLAYGGNVLWGFVFHEDGVNAALAWCDYTWEYEVEVPNLYGFLPIDPFLSADFRFYQWGWAVHGSPVLYVVPPVPPNQWYYGLTVNIATDRWFHDPGGTGPFDGWPHYQDGGHQQMYYKWVERAYEGGLRLMVNFAVHNEILCELSYRRVGDDGVAFTCDDMDAVDRQIDRMYELQEYIDDQCGGQECGWYRIVTSPQRACRRGPNDGEPCATDATCKCGPQDPPGCEDGTCKPGAREVIRDGKMAVIIGIETDFLFGCKPDSAFCDEDYIQEQINLYKSKGVRYIYPVHFFDNKFAGPALYEDLYAFANSFTTGQAMETWDCYDEGYRFPLPAIADLPPDIRRLYLLLEALMPIDLPDWNEDHRAHCAARGLTPTGQILLDLLIEKDMIIDVDHLSHRALEGIPNDASEKTGVIGALRIFEDRFADPDNRRGYKYPVVSSHTHIFPDWDGTEETRIDHEFQHRERRAKRIRDLGGMVYSYAIATFNTARLLEHIELVSKYRDETCPPKMPESDCPPEIDEPFYGEGYPGIGLAFDLGAFTDKTGPPADPPLFEYPFLAFDGSGEFCPQQTGDQVFDFYEDGLAHYGLVPDLLAHHRALINHACSVSGRACVKDEDCKVCNGGSTGREFEPCVTDGDCHARVQRCDTVSTCVDIQCEDCGVCVGGSWGREFEPCVTDDDCHTRVQRCDTVSTCVDMQCSEKQNRQPCENDEDCSLCVGAPSQGDTCTSNDDCYTEAGQECDTVSTCSEKENRRPCENDADCRLCVGAPRQGDTCASNDECYTEAGQTCVLDSKCVTTECSENLRPCENDEDCRICVGGPEDQQGDPCVKDWECDKKAGQVCDTVSTCVERDPVLPRELVPLFNSAETFIRMWERIEQCTPDTTPPELTIPEVGDVRCHESSGTATAWDFCDQNPIVTYEDEVSVGKCPTIIKRTWKATDNSNNETTDVQTITVVNTMPDLTFEVLPGGLPVDICFEANEKVMVHVRMGPANSQIVAAQFSVQYDPSVLAFNAITPGSAVDPMSPFTFEFAETVDEATGTIFYAVGVDPFGGVGTHGPATLAGISFTTISDCNKFDIRCFDINPPAAFTNTNGAQCTCGDCFDTGTFQVDGSLPKLECPVSVHRNPDCDGTTALVTWDPPTATQSCAGDLPVECTAAHDGGEDITHLINGGGEFPQGTSTFTCSATNICGATDSCTWEVTVTPYQAVDLTVQLSPIISGDVERCIEFELFSDCVQSPLVFQQDIFFGGLFDHVGHFTDLIKIPGKAQWQCITARDQLHTLRSCAWLECIDGVYYAVFKGDPFFGGNWLVGANLDGFKKGLIGPSHDVIDIMDFGMFVSRWGELADPNTICGTPGPHADINGDGVVDALDFTFIMMNFLDHSKDCCCPDTTAGTTVGRTEISVRELREMGLGELAVGDLNRDGLLNMDDVQAFQAGEMQPRKGSRDRAGMSR